MEADLKKNKISGSTDLHKNGLLVLIVILLVVYLLQSFAYVFYLFTFSKEQALVNFVHDVQNNMQLPLSSNEFFHKPWTMITQMFYHVESWELISHIIWLFVFGFLFQQVESHKKIIALFVYGAFGSAMICLLLYNVTPLGSMLPSKITGVSGGVMAIAVATMVHAPNYKIFPLLKGGIPIWIITVIYLIIDFIINASNGLLIIDAVGGVIGFLFIYFLKKGIDGSGWMNNFFNRCNYLFDPKKGQTKTKEDV